MVNPTERFLLNHSLHAAGLDKRAPFGLGKAAVLAAIRQLGYVQIDTISVVARAHHHVLWSRVPGYRRTWLDELQQERKILEYWAHAAAYLPMEAFRFTLPSKKYFRDRKDGWQKCAPKLKKQILQIIGEEGPKMARDLKLTANANLQDGGIGNLLKLLWNVYFLKVICAAATAKVFRKYMISRSEWCHHISIPANLLMMNMPII